MAKYASSAARKMAQQHAKEVELCSKYMNACKQEGDKQGVKDFTRLVREHAAAWLRYTNMATWEYRHNLEAGAEIL